MIDSMSAPSRGRTATQADRFERVGYIADPDTAALTRAELGAWLTDYFDLGPDRTGDVQLAIYEALANIVEFAYMFVGGSGTVDVRAWHDPAESSLTVSVADRGLWRTATSTPADRSRGRGIALMKALSDHASIQTSSGGTVVRLTWVGVRPLGR